MNATGLLAAYRETGSEDAFAQLVREYTNLVYSVAKRRLSSGALAEEAVQTVFTRLAKAAPKVSSDAELIGWLHRTAIHVAIDLWRSESRRHKREQYTAAMKTAPAENDQLWEEAAPILDEALNRLSDDDRQALLLRFFDRKAMRDVGRILGVSEDAAKMRVSRAVDRLRAQMALRGITCTATALAIVLEERSLEAAPTQLAAKLHATKLRTASSGAGILVNFRRLLPTSKVTLMTGIATVVIIGIGLISFFRAVEPDRSGKASEAPANQPPASSRRKSSGVTTSLNRTQPPEPEKVKLMLRVLDAETDEGLPNAKIHMAYFYAGGRGEGHDLLTDESGSAAIPEPNESGDKGMNIFVTADGHVPKVVGLGSKGVPAEYTMRLDRALSVGGIIVDPQGQPVPGVKIRVQNPEYQRGETVDFQMSAVTSDADGRWLCTYIPKDFPEIRFILTHDDYAVTLPIVPVGKFDLINLKLIILPGTAVVGQITDSEGHAIAEATVKELNNNGYRRQSTQTAADGHFVIQGLRDSLRSYYFVEQDGIRENPSQPLRLGETDIDLVVQAKGFAAEKRTVHLTQLTNVVNFRLAKGNVFRGRVLDEAGNPIPEAVVRTDSDNQGVRKFDLWIQTDTEGRFQWDSAPAEPVLFWFEAKGYQPVRELSLVADGSDHLIKLTPKAAE